jgi:hypothetical protein
LIGRVIFSVGGKGNDGLNQVVAGDDDKSIGSEGDYKVEDVSGMIPEDFCCLNLGPEKSVQRSIIMMGQPEPDQMLGLVGGSGFGQSGGIRK